MENVLRRYSRAVVHMREQKRRGRFGLILGAGASADFNFPRWDDLIQRIAAHAGIGAPDAIRAVHSHARQAQLLKKHLDDRHKFAGITHAQGAMHEATLKALWHEIIRECLYRTVPSKTSELLNRDKYLWAFLPIIKGRGVTINYNFDDSLQTMISETRDAEERLRSRGYRNVLNAELPISDQEGVIYHPNGYLPRQKAERASEDLVFQEKDFDRAADDSMRGRYASLSHYLAQTTRLLIGLSLEDAMLDKLLRQNAQNYPGHCHYRVELVRRENCAEERATRNSHWDAYNIITLFLTKQQIAALGVLLSMSDDDFGMLTAKLGIPVYRFFLTGAVAVGKSTAVSHFYSLLAHDEWLEMRVSGMERDPSLVDAVTIAKIDQWVADQFHRKNHILSRAESGIHIIDRSPLDPFGFTRPSQWRKKAHLLRSTIAPKESSAKLSDGAVILLLGDPEIMAARAVAKQKHTTPDLLRHQQDLLHKVFEDRGRGVRLLQTTKMSREQVAKEIATVIYFDETYEPAPMHDWLCGLESGEIGYEAKLWDSHVL